MQNFSEYVNTLKRKIKFSKEETIFVCIGSKNVVWDSIGPYVGSLLKRRIGEKYVVGDLENNVCSKNDLVHYYPKFKNKFVVAIDSAVSSRDLHGQIFVTERPIVMGLGVNRNRGIVGDVGIKVGTGIEVSDERYVVEMANVVVEGILFFWDRFFCEQFLPHCALLGPVLFVTLELAQKEPVHMSQNKNAPKRLGSFWCINLFSKINFNIFTSFVIRFE